MIPLVKEYVRGYYLVNELGDLYCYGDIPFPGTVKLLFGSSNKIISIHEIAGGVILTSATGEVMTIAHHPEFMKIPGEYSVVDSFFYNAEHLFLCSDGTLINIDGEAIRGSLSEQNNFVACSLSSSRENLYCTTSNGDVSILNMRTHEITDVKNSLDTAQIMGIECLPWNDGYWLVDEPGGVFCFGDSGYHGSAPEDGSRIQACDLVSSPTGKGYWIVDSRGMVLPFGDAVSFGFPWPGEVTGSLISLLPIVSADRQDRNWLFTKLVNKDMSILTGAEAEEIPEPTVKK